ncbi:MAG: cupin domain-containing protein [Pseudomonadota bacterium]|nr:cupin domain-containing protein [Pseudomonadota bacterium]
MQFEDFDTDAFLRDHWQKSALLIRNPWDVWANPLEPDELAGLACEEEVEARLVTQMGGGWQLEHGPFAEARFGALGKAPWTLLVQAVDHYVPEVTALIAPFRFIPNWRIDDVMVSYASDGGGVGPHFDQYDVFLIQGLGRRRWQIGARCDEASALLPHEDLRLLSHFEATDEWVLEPGDILYVPPGVAHEGVAVGDDCMTYSIGFRAPSRGELIAGWTEHLLAEMRDDDRYADPGLQAQKNPGEISAAAIARLHKMVTETMHDRAAFARWFGEHGSAPKNPDLDWRPEAPIEGQELRSRLAAGETLRRNPASRYSFVREDAGSLLLFVDGETFECADETAALAEKFCAHGRILIDPEVMESDAATNLIANLFNQGSVSFDQDE